MAKDRDWERLGRLPSEAKVDICLDMSETCVRVCADGIRAQNLGVSEKELLEKLRERLDWSRQWRKRER